MKTFSSQLTILLNISSVSQTPLRSSLRNGMIGVDSPGSKMMGTSGEAFFRFRYWGALGNCVSSTAILNCSEVAVILPGVRPRLVAMMLKLFSILTDGSTVIRSHGLCESMMDSPISSAADAEDSADLVRRPIFLREDTAIAI